jgi:putative membrane protein
MYGFHGMGWGMGFGWILGIIALIVIIWLIVKAVNYSNQSHDDNGKSALDVLKKRFAKGEISREEYEEMKKMIEP